MRNSEEKSFHKEWRRHIFRHSFNVEPDLRQLACALLLIVLNIVAHHSLGKLWGPKQLWRKSFSLREMNTPSKKKDTLLDIHSMLSPIWVSLLLLNVVNKVGHHSRQAVTTGKLWRKRDEYMGQQNLPKISSFPLLRWPDSILATFGPTQFCYTHPFFTF